MSSIITLKTCWKYCIYLTTFKATNICDSYFKKEYRGRVEVPAQALAFIRGLRLDPPLPRALALGLTPGQRGLGADPSPSLTQFFGRGFLIAGGRESQGNPPSTPAPVIRPSMCQSRRTRWQAGDDTAVVLSPLFAAWTSQTQENIPVIMAFQCQLACWVWPEAWDWQRRDNMFASCTKFIGKGWGFLAHECSVVLDEKLFVETNYQITFTSTELPGAKNHGWRIHTLLYSFQKYNHTTKKSKDINFNAMFKQKIHFLWTKCHESSHFFPPFWKWSFPFSSCQEGILFLDTRI